MNRYIRQQQLAQIGDEGQRLISSATVLIIGCGALGTIASLYLAGAGVGHLIIADFDTIDLSNLHRQPAYTEADLGQSKATTLRQRLLARNSQIRVTALESFVRSEELQRLVADADVVIDASDNPDTKFMISDICSRMKVNCVLGGVDGWNGQVMVQTPGATTYRQVFEDAESSGFTPCSIGGVLGPLPGIVGSMEAVETIKLITHAGNSADRLLLIDTLNGTFQTIFL